MLSFYAHTLHKHCYSCCLQQAIIIEHCFSFSSFCLQWQKFSLKYFPYNINVYSGEFNINWWHECIFFDDKPIFIYVYSYRYVLYIYSYICYMHFLMFFDCQKGKGQQWKVQRGVCAFFCWATVAALPIKWPNEWLVITVLFAEQITNDQLCFLLEPEMGPGRATATEANSKLSIDWLPFVRQLKGSRRERGRGNEHA